MTDPEEFAAILERLVDGRAMDERQAQAAMDRILAGDLGPERMAAFITAIRAKGAGVPELVGFARSMRAHAHQMPHGLPAPVLDTCGTGGARYKPFNVSTASAFVLAACGVRVAKHGNRSVTRPSGSADALEAAGARLAVSPEETTRILREHGVAFLFAPSFHPAMKHAAPVRQALGIKTVFNLLGPLTNPAGATHQVLGVYDPALVEPMAQALSRLGCRGGFVVHGEPGFDEATPCGPVQYAAIQNGAATGPMVLNPGRLGIAAAGIDEIAPVPKAEAGSLMRDVLEGKASAPRNDAVALNAAFGLVATGKAPGLPEGLAQARDAMRSGAARAKLEAYVAATRSER